MSLHVLISWQYIATVRALWPQVPVVSKVLPLMMDSGAHSARTLGVTIDIDTYERACEALGPHLYGYVQLDVIGNAAATLRNLDHHVTRGLEPMPVLTVDMQAKRVTDFATINKKICVAGGINEPIDWYGPRLNTATALAPGSRLHGLGFTRGIPVARTTVATVDSSSYKEGTRWGLILLWDPLLGLKRIRYIKLKGVPFALWPPRHRAAIAESGFTSEEFVGCRQSGMYSPTQLMSITNWLAYADWLAGHGIRLFFAVNGPQDWGPLFLCARHRTGTRLDWRGASAEVEQAKRIGKDSTANLALWASEASRRMKPVVERAHA